MTPTPEWYAADEDDADRVPARNWTLTASEPENAPTPTREPDGAREGLVEQLAEAIRRAFLDMGQSPRYPMPIARAVLPLVEAHAAAQVEAAVSVVRAERDAEIERLKGCNAFMSRECDEWHDRAEHAEARARVLADAIVGIAEAAGCKDPAQMNGPQLLDLAEQTRDAVARMVDLQAKVEALAESWVNEYPVEGRVPWYTKELRAALSGLPATGKLTHPHRHPGTGGAAGCATTIAEGVSCDRPREDHTDEGRTK